MKNKELIIPLIGKDLARLSNYEFSVKDHFSRKFQEADNRIIGGDRLIERFLSKIKIVKDKGRSHFHAAHEFHNELCVAAALIDSEGTFFNIVRYEPPLPHTKKTIDFVAESREGIKFYVDVKTIRPKSIDGWNHYMHIQDEKKLSPNVEVVFSKEWLGGELWHNKYASRGRMLEYTLEFEEKIRKANLRENNARFVMVFCGEGYHWHEDELEDFADFYRSGQHRADDPFGNMESWEIQEKDIRFDKSILSFASMRRYQFELSPERLNWNVGSL